MTHIYQRILLFYVTYILLVCHEEQSQLRVRSWFRLHFSNISFWHRVPFLDCEFRYMLICEVIVGQRISIPWLMRGCRTWLFTTKVKLLFILHRLFLWLLPLLRCFMLQNSYHCPNVRKLVFCLCLEIWNRYQISLFPDCYTSSKGIG